MRYLTWIRSTENAGIPPQALFDAMNKFIERSVKSGKLLDTGGLAPTSQGSRIRMSKGKLKTTDGPFTEAKEVVGGYAIINAGSRDEAMQIAEEFMELHRAHWPEFEGESEVRQIMDLPLLDSVREELSASVKAR